MWLLPIYMHPLSDFVNSEPQKSFLSHYRNLRETDFYFYFPCISCDEINRSMFGLAGIYLGFRRKIFLHYLGFLKCSGFVWIYCWRQWWWYLIMLSLGVLDVFSRIVYALRWSRLHFTVCVQPCVVSWADLMCNWREQLCDWE